MTQDEWKSLALKLDQEAQKPNHGVEVQDVLSALRTVAWGMWSDLNIKRHDL